MRGEKRIRQGALTGGGDTAEHRKKINLARSFRKRPTEAEYLLWGYLKGRQLGGFKFRRQVPIGEHIVDFVCLLTKVVVEADGESHVLRQAEDRIRDEWLESEGYQVLRFWNREILDDTDRVLEAILGTCSGRLT